MNAPQSRPALPSTLQDSADRLLEKYAESTGSLAPPVDIAALAGILGARIVDGDHDVPGLTVRDGDHYTISLGRGSRLSNSGRLTHRGRFTVAHEIGHLLIASPKSSDPPAFRLPGDAVEIRCNQVAEALLMPVSLVHQEFVFRRHGEVRIKTITEQAKRFDVSLQAFAKRLASLELLGDRWVLGWNYRGGEGPDSGLRLAWATADSSKRVVIEPMTAVNGGCAIRTFRTGLPHHGGEVVLVEGRRLHCQAEAEPAGRSGVVEVITKHAGSEPGDEVQLTAQPIEVD